MAYEVPPNIFGTLWYFYSQSSAQNLHSIIMTVPFEDCVGSEMDKSSAERTSIA